MRGWKMRRDAAEARRTERFTEREQIRQARAAHYAGLASGELAAEDPVPIEPAEPEIPDDVVIEETDEFIGDEADDTGATEEELVQEPPETAETGASEADESKPAAEDKSTPPEEAGTKDPAGDAKLSLFEMTDEQIAAALSAAGVTVNPKWKRPRLMSEARTRGIAG